MYSREKCMKNEIRNLFLYNNVLRCDYVNLMRNLLNIKAYENCDMYHMYNVPHMCTTLSYVLK